MTSRLPVTAPAWHAELHLRFTRAGARSVLRDNRHQGPLRVQKALYPEGEARALVDQLPNARYARISSPHGHDAFLIEFPQVAVQLRRFLADA